MKTTDVHGITDLRKKPWAIIKEAQSAPQFIFKNNKVIGVLISPDDYDSNFNNHNTLYEITYDDLPNDAKIMRDESQNYSESDYISYKDL
jgi:hypothetical protein